MPLDANCTVVALPENEVFVVNEPLLPSKVGPPDAVTAGVIAAGATVVVVPPPELPVAGTTGVVVPPPELPAAGATGVVVPPPELPAAGAPVGIAEPRFPPPPPPHAAVTTAAANVARRMGLCGFRPRSRIGFVGVRLPRKSAIPARNLGILRPASIAQCPAQ